MKILITGIAGFIAFNFAKEISKNKNVKIVGIDNFSDYYSVRLKKKRIQLLKKNKNFKFLKIDLIEKEKIMKIFKTFKFDEVYNFAAQAGVRYSMENPSVYIDSNVSGFSNLISAAQNFKTKKFFYASSSSVYGDNNKFPLHEKERINPKNIYGLSKKFNEEIAQNFFEIYNFKSTGLRFFTVFGEWGRPDMFIMKFLKSLYSNQKLDLFNKGNHSRDFTYIDDVIEIIKKLIVKKSKKKYQIFNLCSNRPIHLKKLIKIMIKYTQVKPNIVLKKFQKADVFKTHGDNKKIKKYLNYSNFTSIDKGIEKTIKWYKENKIWKYN